jgi:ubiquinone/menaquinone biosynthesis C-methylase UbiE
MKIVGVHDKATAFDGAATVYEQVRPHYPPEAVAWLTEALGLGPGRRVVDLAAGTGKLTRDLIPSGAQVIAVEPVAGMRHALAATTGATTTGAATNREPTTAAPTSERATNGPAVSVVAAVAQALPLRDGVLDAVTVAQGFHWFATPEAVAELHRVMRPGGALGLIWNHRDSDDPLQAAMTELMEPMRQGTPSYNTGQWRQALEPGHLFAAEGELHVPWRQPTDVEGVADRVASVSFIAALPEGDRRRLLDRLRGVASAMAAPLSFSYVADVFVFRRVD